MPTITPKPGMRTARRMPRITAIRNTAYGNQGYFCNSDSIHVGTPWGAAAPAAWFTVGMPGGTTLGGAALTVPLFTRARRFVGLMAAVKGNDCMSRARGLITRRMTVDV